MTKPMRADRTNQPSASARAVRTAGAVGHALPLLPLVVALGLSSGLPLVSSAAETDPGTVDAPAAADLAREVAGLIRQLDSDRFDARRQAATKLQELKSRPEAAAALAAEFQRVLVSPDTPFEVRRQVERLQAGLPAAAATRKEAVPAEEIQRLLKQLEDDRFGVRVGAARRLEWLMDNPKLACAIYGALKQQIERSDLSLDSRRRLEPICVQARGAWLAGDPATWDLPAVADSQILAWIDEFSQPAADRTASDRGRAVSRAAQELRDLLARDPYTAKVVQAVEARLARGVADPRAARRLRDLLDLTRPAMVAEFWQGRRRANPSQHLTIGVPSQSPGADRPSHFEYIDDDTAFCVSGQNLSPGNYPVGIAFPHPRSHGAIFHLANLSGPRRKMAYECATAGDQHKRLAAITRRTLDRFLAARQRLSLEELLMLEQLDVGGVSRFAGRYFLVVDDQAIPEGVLAASLNRPMFPGADRSIARPLQSTRASRHGAICCVLAVSGTQEAVPGLLTAIEKDRFLPPTPQSPYRLPWLAALAIALRDPWPGADAWLAGTVARTDLLMLGRDRGPELGATAAAILLTRHGMEPAQFGLKEAGDSLLDRFDLAGYRAESPQSRQRIRQWWSELRTENRL